MEEELLILEMLKILIDDFNCNHQQDLESENQVKIYTRDREQDFIEKFVRKGLASKKSQLMYLCGHPGTGKTSTLHLVLSKFKNQSSPNYKVEGSMMIKLYNAMTFKDVKKYCQRLYMDLTLDLTGEEVDEERVFKSSKTKLMEEDIAHMIAKTLRNRSDMIKIIVIDEIDAFEAHERGFLALTKAILESKSNTILIGIANSVDLPFKKKHSAIALRDTQLLFEPYTEEQIVSIIEQKINLQYVNMSDRMKQNARVKKMFFDIIDESAKVLIAKRVARMNGDLRVAFDIIKSCFVGL